VNCDKPLCCRVGSGIPKDLDDASGYWGTAADCDVPIRTVEQIANWSAVTLKPDLVLWTGDNNPHDVWNQTREYNTNNTLYATEIMQKSYGNSTVIPMFGNHDRHPVNEYDFTNDREIEMNSKFAEIWEPWIGHEAAKEFSRFGYYQVFNKDFEVRVIALNTEACNDENWFLFKNSTDPGDMLQWLQGVLAMAERNDEPVWIVGHIPPGDGDCLDDWSTRYRAVVDRYSYNIRGQFFAHTHNDHFELSKSYISNETTSIVFIAPSVTTFSYHFPAVRQYVVDWDTKIPIDYQQYRLNLTKWNALGQGPVNLDLEYDFLEEYGLPDMSFESYEILRERLLSDTVTYEKANLHYEGLEGRRVDPKDLYCQTVGTPDRMVHCLGLSNFSKIGYIQNYVVSRLEGRWLTQKKI